MVKITTKNILNIEEIMKKPVMEVLAFKKSKKQSNIEIKWKENSNYKQEQIVSNINSLKHHKKVTNSNS